MKSRRRLKGGGDENQQLPPPLRCQCSGCDKSVQKGETFCEIHKQGCSIKSPLSGWEPKFSPGDYNNDKAIQHSHNCFAYAMNVRDKVKIDRCRKSNDCRFHVPGKTRGHPGFTGTMGKTCSDVIMRTMADVFKGYLLDFQTKPKDGYSKIAVVVDKDNDLHYYRQDSNGWWSHKPGGRPVTNLDAAGARIWDPQRASRYYPKEHEGDTGLNYSSFCGYMAVPRNKPIQIAGGTRRRRR